MAGLLRNRKPGAAQQHCDRLSIWQGAQGRPELIGGSLDPMGNQLRARQHPVRVRRHSLGDRDPVGVKNESCALVLNAKTLQLKIDFGFIGDLVEEAKVRPPQVQRDERVNRLRVNTRAVDLQLERLGIRPVLFARSHEGVVARRADLLQKPNGLNRLADRWPTGPTKMRGASESAESAHDRQLRRRCPARLQRPHQHLHRHRLRQHLLHA